MDANIVHQDETLINNNKMDRRDRLSSSLVVVIDNFDICFKCFETIWQQGVLERIFRPRSLGYLVPDELKVDENAL